MGQDRWPRRRRRRARARARSAARRQVDGPVDVFLPRYRIVPSRRRRRSSDDDRPARAGPAAPAGASDGPIIDVAADGYRLRLVDHPAAFDREGLYGDAAGDYADNAWRFGLFCRAALEALRADGRPVDVLHLHDWHTGPAALFRDVRYADDPIIGRAAILITLHNLAYHGWTRRTARSASSGCDPATGSSRPDADGIDLLRGGDRARRARQHGLAGVRRARR